MFETNETVITETDKHIIHEKYLSSHHCPNLDMFNR